MSGKIQFPEPISSVIARVMERVIRKQQSFSEQQKPRKQKQNVNQ